VQTISYTHVLNHGINKLQDTVRRSAPESPVDDSSYSDLF
jgi:hypothetical protein